MFGKRSHRQEKELEEKGKRAEAVVLEKSERQMAITKRAAGVVANTESAINTHLKVEPADEPTFEVKERFRFPQLAVPAVGSRISVIYDPDNHDSITLDTSPTAMLAGTRFGNADASTLVEMAQAATASPDYGPQQLAAQMMAQMGVDGSTAFAGGQTAPAGQAGAGAQGATDPIEQVERLAKLRASGALTEEE